LCSNERVIARYQREVEEHNQKFGKWERVKTFEITPEEWTIQAEHLTPTLKLKRRNIKARYQDLYNKIYGAKI
jgi:long-chain acyl-CoA synthetase